jgi:hypothetical protein
MVAKSKPRLRGSLIVLLAGRFTSHRRSHCRQVRIKDGAQEVIIKKIDAFQERNGNWSAKP